MSINATPSYMKVPLKLWKGHIPVEAGFLFICLFFVFFFNG